MHALVCVHGKGKKKRKETEATITYRSIGVCVSFTGNNGWIEIENKNENGNESAKEKKTNVPCWMSKFLLKTPVFFLSPWCSYLCLFLAFFFSFCHFFLSLSFSQYRIFSVAGKTKYQNEATFNCSAYRCSFLLSFHRYNWWPLFEFLSMLACWVFSSLSLFLTHSFTFFFLLDGVNNFSFGSHHFDKMWVDSMIGNDATTKKCQIDDKKK